MRNMTYEQFAFWLRGFMDRSGTNAGSLAQWGEIRTKLNDVFGTADIGSFVQPSQAAKPYTPGDYGFSEDAAWKCPTDCGVCFPKF